MPERVARPAAALGLAILCCVPWTVRNYVQFQRWIPLRSNFPFELWSGNNEVFDPRSPDINARVTRYGEQRRYVQLGETAFMQEKWQLATHSYERIRSWKCVSPDAGSCLFGWALSARCGTSRTLIPLGFRKSWW